MNISADMLAQFLIVASMAAGAIMLVRDSQNRKRIKAKAMRLLDAMPFDTMSDEGKAYHLHALGAQAQVTDAQRAAIYGGSAYGTLR